MKRRLGSICTVRRCLIALAAFACAFTTARGQVSAPVVLRGRVIDKSSLAAVPGATVAVLGISRQTSTDSLGRFVFGGLHPGRISLVVQASAFPITRIIFDLIGDTTRTIALDSTVSGIQAQSLPAAVTTATAKEVSYRLQDFERRRKTGRGQYLGEVEIRKSTASNVQDLTRGMRGVTLHCGGTTEGGCRIQMIRAPMNCQPDYVVDGRIDNTFGPVTPIRDIVALELYTGPSDVPGEFAGRSAGCGVVVIWTRSGGPTQRLP
jgi:hypothetical protein